jgi:PAS domain S-box-containing protein
MLPASAQIVLFWGPDFIALYNDAFAPSIGNKHPHAIGQPARIYWAELWDDLRPLLERARSGETVVAKDRPFQIERRGYLETVYFDISYSPARNDDGDIEGVVCIVAETTERIAAEQRLRIANERIQLALNAGAVIGTWVWDIPNNRVTGDETFAKSFGLDAEQIAQGMPIGVVTASIHPGDLARVEAAITDALARGGQFRSEYRVRRQTGDYRWIEANGHCELDADGTPLRFPGVLLDIHEKKIAAIHQSVLLELSDRIRDIQNPEDLAFSAAELLGRALEVNRAGYGTIDTAAETIRIERDWNAPGIQTIAGVLHFRDYGSYIDDIKRGETAIITDAEKDPRTRANAAALKAISAQSFVNMPVTERGDSVALLYLNHGEAREWRESELALIREVAERTRTAIARLNAESELRSSEAQFRSFAQTVPNHVWVSQPNGLLDWFNDRVYEYSGAKPGELDGDRWASIVHPDDLGYAAQDWQNALTTGEPYDSEFRIRRADGEYRWHIARAMAIRNPAGEITRWVGTNTDVHDQKDVEAELERRLQERTRELMVAEEALRQSQKMEAVGQLTGGIAHDFNNLLTGIIGSLDILRRRISAGRTDDLDKFMDAATTSANRAAGLTQRLLAFSRRQSLDLRAVDIGKLTHSMADLIRRTLGEQIELRIQENDTLWLAEGDANQIESALLNFAINARDAMPRGGTLTIETRNVHLDPAQAASFENMAAGDYVAIAVSDSGVGMTKEILQRAVDPFFTTKPIGQGTGLGLSMAYGYARQARGHLQIASEAGAGTTVTLYLPRSRRSEEPVEPQAPGMPAKGSGEIVLVVEDDASVRLTVVEVLRDLGYEAIEAVDGKSAIPILESRQRIDLMISDVGLPGMNGRQVADIARHHRPHLKVLFITGYAENAAVRSGLLAPGMQMITKPFAIEALAAHIREMITAPAE